MRWAGNGRRRPTFQSPHKRGRPRGREIRQAETFRVVTFQSPHKRGRPRGALDLEVAVIDALPFQSPHKRGRPRGWRYDDDGKVLRRVEFQSPHKRGRPRGSGHGAGCNRAGGQSFNPLISGADRAAAGVNRLCAEHDRSFNPLISGADRAVNVKNVSDVLDLIVFQSPHKRGRPRGWPTRTCEARISLSVSIPS